MGVVEVWKDSRSKLAVRIDQRLNDLGGDLVANVRLASQGHHALEAGTLGNPHRRHEVFAVCVFVADVLHEQGQVLVVTALISPRSVSQEAQRAENRSDFFERRSDGSAYQRLSIPLTPCDSLIQK
jgi:hypothetical protein